MVFNFLTLCGISWFEELYTSLSIYVSARIKYIRISKYLHYVNALRATNPRSRFHCMQLLFDKTLEQKIQNYVLCCGYDSEMQLRIDVEKTLQLYLQQLDNLTWFNFFRLIPLVQYG